MPLDEAIIGCEEGYFEELSRDVFIPAPDGTPMDEDLIVPRPNDCVVPQIIWSYLPFYDEKAFLNQKPTTMADFFDLEKFPGKRAIHSWPNAIIEMALMADAAADDTFTSHPDDVPIHLGSS